MIKVNLLPLEKRKAEGTPLPRFLSIIGGVVASLLLALTFVFLLLQKNAVENDIADLDRQITEAKATTAKANALQKEVDAHTKRYTAIQDIERSRAVLWAERLDKLAMVLDKMAPMVWLAGIKCTDNPGGTAGPALPAGQKAAVVEASMELTCRSTRDIARGKAIGIVTPEFVDALGATFWPEKNGDFTRYDDRYSETIKTNDNTVEGIEDEFTIKFFRDKKPDAPKPAPAPPPAK